MLKDLQAGHSPVLLEQSEAPSFLLDFDGIFHTSHTRDEIYLKAAVKTVVAYTDFHPDEARALCIRSWEKRRDVMALVVEHPRCKADYYSIYKHYNYMLHDPLKPKLLSGLRNSFNTLPIHGNVAIVSHSPTVYVQQVGMRFGLSPYILMNNTYGIDRVQGNYKHESSKAVLQICDDLGTDPKNATLIDDTAANLSFAKAAGLSTIHVHWGKPAFGDFIDVSVAKTKEAIDCLRSRYPVPRV